MLLSQDQISSWINLEGALDVLFIHLLSVRVLFVYILLIKSKYINKSTLFIYLAVTRKQENI